jgi:hypothetical protein
MTATTADPIAEQATAAVTRARARVAHAGSGSVRAYALKYLRDGLTAPGGTPPDLWELEPAVDAAMAQQTTIKDLEQHRQPVPDPIKGWSWRFPNGRFVSVIPDRRSPARFELLSSDRTDGPHGNGLSTGLTTEQVEALLIDIATRTRD